MSHAFLNHIQNVCFNHKVKVKRNKRAETRGDVTVVMKRRKCKKKIIWRSKSFSRWQTGNSTGSVCAAEQYKHASNCETTEAFLHSLSLHLPFVHSVHVLPPREAINRIKCPWPRILVESVENWLEISQRGAVGDHSAVWEQHYLKHIVFFWEEKKDQTQ